MLTELRVGTEGGSESGWHGGCVVLACRGVVAARKSMATPRGRGRGCSLPITRRANKGNKGSLALSFCCVGASVRSGYGDGSG